MNRDAIAALVRDLGANRRPAMAAEAERLRVFFAESVLPAGVQRGNRPGDYLLRKYHEHVRHRAEWPDDTTPEAYLQSLKATVRNRRGEIYLERDPDFGTWMILFVGRSGRWRRGGSHIVVLFNAERGFWITAFQPPAGRRYVDRQDGFWVWRPS